MLRDDQALRKTILSALDIGFTKAQPGDVCLFHFSGHATPGVLEMYDCQKITFKDLIARRPKPGVKWIVHLDVCFGASFIPKYDVPDLTMLVSSGANELSTEIRWQTRSRTENDSTIEAAGWFTQRTTEVLRKLPDVTASQLIEILSDSVDGQHPQFYGPPDESIMLPGGKGSCPTSAITPIVPLKLTPARFGLHFVVNGDLASSNTSDHRLRAEILIRANGVQSSKLICLNDLKLRSLIYLPWPPDLQRRNGCKVYVKVWEESKLQHYELLELWNDEETPTSESTTQLHFVT